ncbi:MAG: 2-C-methyl-D-erythritol 2,4-cyclodiphosphate synthase [Chitinophagaceae bacterium]|nr:2-C-methyl-D-erythritol 2,4-cyclodiphosphate synthase [Chitinophagaceae bacterium]
MVRIGQGIDFHQLVEGRDLWIGGVKIPHHKGALGHSDADVLLHAICDALLGALGLGDIGTHFPDTSADYKDIDSKVLLQRTIDMVWERGYHVVNIDATLCLQEPKIRPYVDKMQLIISSVVKTRLEDISIKATTTELMGFIGRKEGIAAMAVALLSKNLQ